MSENSGVGLHKFHCICLILYFFHVFQVHQLVVVDKDFILINSLKQVNSIYISSPRNENLSLRVQIKSLKLFLNSSKKKL
jgi:hypothetical protein